MNQHLSILITAFGSSNARACASILQERFPHFKIIGTDSNAIELLTPHPFVSEVFKVPVSNSPLYIGELLKLCARLNIDFLIPIHDDEVIKVALQRRTFEGLGVKTFLSPLKTLKKCRDKFAFFEFGKRHKLPVIDSALSAKFAFPMFIKPIKGNGSINCFKIHNPQEAEVFRKRIPKPFFQVFEHGQLMDVDFIADPKSLILTSVVKEEISTKNGIGVKVKICENPALLILLQELISKLKFVGIGAVEFFINKGKIKIIELNIRPSSGIIFSHMAGGDFFGHFFNAAGYSQIKPYKDEIQFGSRMNREYAAYALTEKSNFQNV